MAISASSSLTWTDVSLSHHSNQKNSKLTFLCRLLEGRRCVVRHMSDPMGKKVPYVCGPLNVKEKYCKRRLIPFATTEDQTEYDDEPSVDQSDEQENEQLISEEVNSESGSDLYTERPQGKPGLISFYGLQYKRKDEVLVSPNKEQSNLVLFVGPAVLVASLVFPSLYLRRILSIGFEDSLLTDFLILFFTEALFYGGVAVFIMLIDCVHAPLKPSVSKSSVMLSTGIGSRISSVATLVLSLLIPLATMGLVWPWTGPAASATLAPYLVGILVQFAFEKYVGYQKSPAWPVVPIIFQVYRLHQLNRAAQLVTALSFSVRGAEATSQTMAINSSLGTLLNVLQFLGVICIWSLSSFLMRFLPSSAIALDQ